MTAVEERVRALCLALPSATERVSHGAPSFFAGRQFLTLWPDGHHDARFPQLWCSAPAGAQERWISDRPDEFFRPPYVGHRGWVGRRLDGRVDWGEIEMLCEDAFRVIAPPAARRQLDGAG